jgi:hypothetical protein
MLYAFDAYSGIPFSAYRFWRVAEQGGWVIRRSNGITTYNVLPKNASDGFGVYTKWR